jgi:hypothetical protein
MKMHRFAPDKTSAPGVSDQDNHSSPIAFVSSIDERGVHNLAPFSFFIACSANPRVVCSVAAMRPVQLSTRPK